MRTTLLMIAAILFCAAGYAQVKNKAKHARKQPVAYSLKNDLDSTSYAYGVGLVKDLKSRGFTRLNYSALNQAIVDGLKDEKTTLLTQAQGKTLISAHFKTAFAANAIAANKFMAENKNKTGVITLASGLQYSVLKDADGPKPKLTDTVSVYYLATLTDGRRFDKTEDGNGVATFIWTLG